MAYRPGAGEIVVNSVDGDGHVGGYDLDLAGEIRRATTLPMTVLGGAGNIGHMEALIDRVGVVGAAAGSLFVFKGPYKAVLISYARPAHASPRCGSSPAHHRPRPSYRLPAGSGRAVPLPNLAPRRRVARATQGG